MGQGYNRSALRLNDEDDDFAWLGIDDPAMLEWLRRNVEYVQVTAAQWFPARRYTPEQRCMIYLLVDAVIEYEETFQANPPSYRRMRGERTRVKRRRELWRWFHGAAAIVSFRDIYEALGIDPARVFRRLRGIERGAH